MNRLIIASFALASFLISCDEKEPCDTFVPGEIIVGLVDSVDFKQAYLQLDSLNFSYQNTGGFSYRIKKSADSLEYYRQQLLNSGLFNPDFDLHASSDSTYLNFQVYFRPFSDQVAAQWFDLAEDLELEHYNDPLSSISPYILINGPEGEEEELQPVIEQLSHVSYTNLQFLFCAY